MRYQQLFKIKIVKIGVWMTSVPVLVVTPILKCCVVMSTLFNQLNTMTSSQSFDPMKTELVSMNGSKMETKKIDNEYDSQESFQNSHQYECIIICSKIFEMTQGQPIFGTFLSCEGTLQVGFQADARGTSFE